MGVLMWVPADWVAAGMTGLPDADADRCRVLRTQLFPTPASIRKQGKAYLRGDPFRNVISGTY
jgi:hypothetical protein